MWKKAKGVTSIRLSRAACMAVAMIADQKKELVKVAQQYFSATMTSSVSFKTKNHERIRPLFRHSSS